MRICFITSEVFVSRHGGFGKLVRIIGRELAKRGFDVYAITWAEPGMKKFMEIDGIKVLSYPYTYTSHSTLKHIVDYSKVIPLIKRVNADVYMSIDCMVETYIAQKIMPDRKHIIWVQDPFPYERHDYKLLSQVDPLLKTRKFNVLKFGATLALYRKAYRNADVILVQALYFYHFKLSRLFKISSDKVVYMPNPVEYIPREDDIQKCEKPTVCYLGRLDPVKRYWIVFELAKLFPDVEFFVIGKPSLAVYEELYNTVMRMYKNLKNLHVIGFINGIEKFNVLSKCWVLALPSIREALPLAFLEALACKCALLSSVDPDKLVTRFGYYAKQSDFAQGLKYLLSDNAWKRKGEQGHEYVKRVHALDKVINRLVKILESF